MRVSVIGLTMFLSAVVGCSGGGAAPPHADPSTNGEIVPPKTVSTVDGESAIRKILNDTYSQLIRTNFSQRDGAYYTTNGVVAVEFRPTQDGAAHDIKVGELPVTGEERTESGIVARYDVRFTPHLLARRKPVGQFRPDSMPSLRTWTAAEPYGTDVLLAEFYRGQAEPVVRAARPSPWSILFPEFINAQTFRGLDGSHDIRALTPREEAMLFNLDQGPLLGEAGRRALTEARHLASNAFLPSRGSAFLVGRPPQGFGGISFPSMTDRGPEWGLCLTTRQELQAYSEADTYAEARRLGYSFSGMMDDDAREYSVPITQIGNLILVEVSSSITPSNVQVWVEEAAPSDTDRLNGILARTNIWIGLRGYARTRGVTLVPRRYYDDSPGTPLGFQSADDNWSSWRAPQTYLVNLIHIEGRNGAALCFGDYQPERIDVQQAIPMAGLRDAKPLRSILAAIGFVPGTPPEEPPLVEPSSPTAMEEPNVVLYR